jgi:putative methionine-R-sulfoxide reductase with GAF domain
VAIFSTKGITLLDTNATDIGVDKSSREYFKKTMETDLPYASDVEFSSTTEVPSFYFTAPVRDATGKVIGVIRIRYFASILQKQISSDTGLAGESSYAVLLDSNHVRLAHGTDRARVFKSIVPLDAEVVKQLQAIGLLAPGTPEELSTNLPDFENGLNNLQQEPFFSADTNSDGALEQVATASMKTKNWSVAFIQSESVFLAGSRTQTSNNLLAAFIVALIVSVAGFLFSQILSGPIIRLTQVAETIAGGDINIQAKVETGDEIGTLAGTFNRMTLQLREFITNLEERVAARTKDLETVAEVGTATATILETDKLLQEVVDLSKERFKLYHSHIYLLDEAGENLVLARGAGEAGRQMKEKGLSIPLNREQSLVARAAREQKGITVNDVTLAPDFLPNPLLPNTRSELAVPMIVGGKVIGVFDVQSDVVGRFTDSDINIQTTLAAQVSTSIQNVRSFEQSKAQADLESLVNSIGQKIQSANTMEDTLQTAIRELGLALGASRVTANIQTNRETIKASDN